MVKQELIQRSPVRVFEKSIHGGLKAGDIGVIAAAQGTPSSAVAGCAASRISAAAVRTIVGSRT